MGEQAARGPYSPRRVFQSRVSIGTTWVATFTAFSTPGGTGASGWPFHESPTRRPHRLLVIRRRGPSGESAALLARMFSNAFGLSATRDPHCRTRQVRLHPPGAWRSTCRGAARALAPSPLQSQHADATWEGGRASSTRVPLPIPVKSPIPVKVAIAACSHHHLGSGAAAEAGGRERAVRERGADEPLLRAERRGPSACNPSLDSRFHGRSDSCKLSHPPVRCAAHRRGLPPRRDAGGSGGGRATDAELPAAADRAGRAGSAPCRPQGSFLL